MVNRILNKFIFGIVCVSICWACTENATSVSKSNEQNKLEDIFVAPASIVTLQKQDTLASQSQANADASTIEISGNTDDNRLFE